jgi:hypothetical protein
MLWIVFGLGVMVGTITGIVVVALCQIASGNRNQRTSDFQPRYPYDPLRSPMLAKDVD